MTMCKDYIAVDMVPGVQLKGKSAETFRIYQVTAIRETPTSPWVPVPDRDGNRRRTRLHPAVHAADLQQQVVRAPGDSQSQDILVGDDAQKALDEQAASALAPTPPYGTPVRPPAGEPLVQRGGDQ